MHVLLGQITIPSDVIAQLFVIFIGVTAALAKLIDMVVRRYGIGNQSMQGSLVAQSIINTGYEEKTQQNTDLRVENAVLRTRVGQYVTREALLKAKIIRLRHQIKLLEKASALEAERIAGYERQIADKTNQITRLEKELENC